MDWSSEESGSPNGRIVEQHDLIGESPSPHRSEDTPGERGYLGTRVKQGQTTPQSSQPAAMPTITVEVNQNATVQTIPIVLPTRQEAARLPTERINTLQEGMLEEEIVSTIGQDTPAVVINSSIVTLRIQQVGATTQTLAPPSESISSPRIPVTSTTRPGINLSVPGYEPVSPRSPDLGPPPVRPKTSSNIPQLDGPRILSTIQPIQERMSRLPSQVRQDASQGGTYVQRTAVSRRGEYPEDGDNEDEYQRSH